MKNLIIINGTIGVGKSAACKELRTLLPSNVFLDGDWCWSMRPFVVNENTKEMVIDNITYVLNNFIHCPEYENIIFCWVMNDYSIIDKVLSKLDLEECRVKLFSLIATEEALTERLKKDIEGGIRKEDSIKRSLEKSMSYDGMETEKIDVSEISPKCAAKKIAQRLND